MDRVLAYHAMNPESHLENRGLRFTRVGFGVWLRDAIGSALSPGQYTNIQVNAAGLYVTASPAVSTTPGAVYQMLAEDGIVPIGSSDFLAADPTRVVLQGLLASATGNIGPVTAPSAGNSVYYLLEAQVTTTDTQPELLTFVSDTGARSSATLNTARQDLTSWQLKSGTPAPSPVAPSVDAGWVPVALILVPSGTLALNSGMITMLPAFAGFQSASSSLPARRTATVTALGVAAGGLAYVTVPMSKTYTIISMTTSIAATVVVYKNAAKRTADVSRPFSTPPAPGSGVIFQGTTTVSALSIDASPEPTGSNTESTPSVNIPLGVTNDSVTTSDVTVSFVYLPMEL
jgi:hypothetical protein